MAQKALVHKQFNSPLGLYSDNNISETLNRELKTLSNGTMGWVMHALTNTPPTQGHTVAALLG